VPIPDIDAWLTSHSTVASRMIFEFPIIFKTLPPTLTSRRWRWAKWPEFYKQRLRDTFAAYWTWNETLWGWYDEWKASNFTVEPVGFNPSPSTLVDADPMPVLDPPASTLLTDGWTVVGSVGAFDLYVKHLAMMLAVEIGGHVPWSVLTYDSKGLAELLDGWKMFDWVPQGPSQWGMIEEAGHRVATLVVPAPPMITASFLVINGLVGSTPLDTIERILNWCRANLWHVFGGPIASGKSAAEVYWQYEGSSPVSRMINGTTMLEPVGNVFEAEPHHWTAGCGGTSGFIKEALRPVNIPVEVVVPSHFMPHFVAEQKYLSHGDDPYGLADEIPMSELPIDQQTYEAWFVNDPNPLHNVGRRVAELTIEYLPLELLKHHCLDVALNKDHASSLVYNSNFASAYTVAELEALQLWENIEAKITSLGGCNNLP